ncbi:MAG: hypothetical protein NTY19_34450 [Planctomycetota bacterium]|nr:hypothetical protein [Planctomycetota bacterium]
MPIGLINSSVGGTPIESWISAEAQAKVPELQAQAADETKAAKFDETQANYGKALARWSSAIAAAARGACSTARSRR